MDECTYTYVHFKVKLFQSFYFVFMTLLYKPRLMLPCSSLCKLFPFYSKCIKITLDTENMTIVT